MGGVAERPRAQPVPRIDERALIEQSGGEVDAIGICGGEQRQRHLDRGELGLSRLILAVELAAPCWIRRGRSHLRCANDEQRGQSNATIQDALLRHGVVTASPFRSASHDPPLLPSRARRVTTRGGRSGQNLNDLALKWTPACRWTMGCSGVTRYLQENRFIWPCLFGAPCQRLSQGAKHGRTHPITGQRAGAGGVADYCASPRRAMKP